MVLSSKFKVAGHLDGFFNVAPLAGLVAAQQQPVNTFGAAGIE